MTTVSLHSEGDTTLDQFDSFMADLLWEKEVNPSLYIVVTNECVVLSIKFHSARRSKDPSIAFTIKSLC